MMVSLRNALVGNAKAAPSLKTCILKGLSSNRLAIDINGLGDVSMGGWMRNPPYYNVATGWRETGGWGSTYIGQGGEWNKIGVRFGTGSSATAWDGNYDLSDDEWYHIYLVRQGSQMQLYVNGMLVDTKSANSTLLQRNGGFSLTQGLYDQVNTATNYSTVGYAFFSRALTASEINAAMNAVTVDLTKAPYNSGCVMALNCTEGSGNKIKELVSGNYIELSQTPVWDVEIPAKKETPTFLQWLQSDGQTGCVDTGFVVSDYRTRMTVEAAFTSGPNRLENGSYGVITLAGIPSNTLQNDLSYKTFGFCPHNWDRQLYMRIGYAQIWNTTAYRGNWDDGAFHVIDIGAVSTSSVTASLDGVSIPEMILGNSGALNALPSDSQTIFAAKYNGEYSHFAIPYKVKRVAYSLDGVLLADFRAASLDGTYGFYDMVAGEFKAGIGSFTAGDPLTD